MLRPMSSNKQLTHVTADTGRPDQRFYSLWVGHPLNSIIYLDDTIRTNSRRISFASKQRHSYVQRYSHNGSGATLTINEPYESSYSNTALHLGPRFFKPPSLPELQIPSRLRSSTSSPSQRTYQRSILSTFIQAEE